MLKWGICFSLMGKAKLLAQGSWKQAKLRAKRKTDFFKSIFTMNNDPELNGKYLGTITSDFAAVSDNLKEASYQIRKRDFSDYPIFPISKVEIPIGQLLIGRTELGSQWNYYASFLDEFVQRKLIDAEKVEEFKSTYKNPDEFCCLFVVDPAFTKFLYVPYPED